jgi:ParB family chromosome partitioning protein
MDKGKVFELDIDDILPNRFQPRINFSERNINELAESIKEYGVIQPIVVRKISDKYEIIAGERRYKASIIANKTTIPAIIVDLNDKDAAEVAIIENVQRQDLTAIEEAVSYKKILDMGMTQEQLAKKLGKNQSTVANKLRLLNLIDEVQEALLYHKISERHARSLLKLDEEGQHHMLKRIIDERLTVRKTDQAIYDYIVRQKHKKEEFKETRPVENKEAEEKVKATKPAEQEIKEIEQIKETSNSKLDEIEVLDFDDDREEENMPNNDNLIPNTQIIDDTVEEQGSIMDNPNNVNMTINPGFMDVDKIQNQAQDIYVDNKPKVDMDSLLSGANKTEETTSEVSTIAEQNNEQTTVDMPTNTNKFFNLEPNNSSFVEDIDSTKANVDFMPQEEQQKSTFNFDSFFNNSYQPTRAEDITTELSKQRAMNEGMDNQFKQDNNDIINNTNAFDNTNSIDNKAEQVNPTVSNMGDYQNNDAINEISSNLEFNNSMVETPINTINQELNNDNQNISVNPTNIPNIDNGINSQMDNNVINTEVTPENQTISMVEPQTSVNQINETESTYNVELPVNNDNQNISVNPTNIPNINNGINSQMDSNVMNTEVIPEPVSMNNVNLNIEPSAVNEMPKQEETSDSNSQEDVNGANIREAIDKIRQLATQLENMGFNIDVEEYALEDKYEVMFKIKR